MQSVSTDEMALRRLPVASRQCHKFDKLTMPLVLVGQFCDAGLSVLLIQYEAVMRDINGNPVLRAWRDPLHKLYLMNLTNGDSAPTPHQTVLSVAYSGFERQVVPKLMAFLHGCLYYLPQSNILRAIWRGWLNRFPGLTSANVTKYIGKNKHTTTGHLKCVRQGIWSTNRPQWLRVAPMGPSSLSLTQQFVTRNVDVSSHSFQIDKLSTIDGTCAADFPGRYPITSRRGHKYVYVLVRLDTNNVFFRPLKSRKSLDEVPAFESCVAELTKGGFNPRVICLDNEVSGALITAI